MKKQIYIIWIGWIWISAIARYYLHLWYKIFWSDQNNSGLIEKLREEGCKIITPSNPPLDGGIKTVPSKEDWEEKIWKNLEKVIYTEAVPQNNPELIKAKELWLKIQTYPEALAEIANNKKLIAIAWTHWKSTTSSLTAITLKNSNENINAVIWTILKEFNWKNAYFSDSEYFVIEACEYKRSFLRYKPLIWAITNIDLDHLDYYKDLNDYISAFDEFINNIRPWGFAILNWNCPNSKILIWKRKNINYIEIYDKYAIYTKIHSSQPSPLGKKEQEQISEIITFPEMNMKVPWEHILFDAHIAYMIGHMVWIEDKEIVNSLENYTWVWRRMEIIWETKNKNILMSDYGHHPTEISLTLKALKDQNPARPILTVFQPHQYNRTYELLENFKTCFFDTDKLIIPNIYESRDSLKDKKKINTQKFIDYIKHDNKVNWENFERTLKLIKKWDKENQFWIILLQWAWDIDNLRHKIKTII